MARTNVDGDRASDSEEGAQRGILFASGAVAGEALVGVGVALLVGLGMSPRGWGGAAQVWLAWPLALVVLGAFARALRAQGERSSP